MIPKLLAAKIAELFVIMILGFVLAKFGIVKKDDSKVLSKLSLYLLMPAVIISAFNIDITPSIVKGMVLAFAAAIIIHVFLLIIDVLYKKLLKATVTERASVMYPNAANLIVPIVSFVLGDEWIIYTSAFVSVQLIFIWTHCSSMYMEERSINLKKILLNVNIIAIVFGITMLISGFKLPEFAVGAVDSLGSMLGSIGMLICGILAAFVDFRKILSDKRTYTVCLLRMIICPCIALLILWVLNINVSVENSDKILLITFLACMTPSAATITQFSQLYGKEPDFAVGVNIITTLICIVTMPVFVAVYQSII